MRQIIPGDDSPVSVPRMIPTAVSIQADPRSNMKNPKCNLPTVIVLGAVLTIATILTSARRAAASFPERAKATQFGVSGGLETGGESQIPLKTRETDWLQR